jgi:hypothetical protein
MSNERERRNGRDEVGTTSVLIDLLGEGLSSSAKRDCQQDDKQIITVLSFATPTVVRSASRPTVTPHSVKRLLTSFALPKEQVILLK